MENKISSISVILPAYNEGNNIYYAVKSAYNAVRKYTSDFEIIVIDDGSKDNTAYEAKRAAKEFNQVKVETQENKGYGGAIKRGFELASKDWIFFTDSDLQFDIEQISHLIDYSNEYSFVFGYRKRRIEGFKRSFIAFLLKIWNKVLLNFPSEIKDIDCAFKLMRKDDFMKTYPLISTGAMINTEFILKINLLGYKIMQIPVDHFARKSGKSSGSDLNVIKNAIKETFILRENIQSFKKKP